MFMFCPNCGSKNPDSAAFCERCGSALTETAPVKGANTGYTQPVYTPAPQPTPVSPVYPAPAVRVNTPRPPYSVIGAVKSVCASPLALIAVIATSVNLLLLLIFFLSGGYNALVFNVANRLLSFMFQSNGGDYYDVLNTAYGYSRYLTVYYLIALLPSIVYVAGLWITYISASRRGSDSMSTAGLLMAKIINIISLISTCVLFAVTLIVYIILIIAAVVGASSDSPGSSALAVGFSVLAVTLVFILAVFILAVIYRAKTVSSINAVRNTITTGNSVYRVSGFVAVMNFIVSVFSLFAMFFGGIIYVLAIISAITARVCFALLLFKFNAAMRRVTPKQNPPIGYANSYSQPQYPNSGYGQM